MTRIALRAAALAIGLGIALPALAQTTPTDVFANPQVVEWPGHIIGGAVRLYDINGNVLGGATHPMMVQCPDGTTSCFGGSSGGGTVTLGAGSANIGSVQPVAQSTGGMSVLSKQVANNTTSFAVDASVGTLYGVSAYNNSATIAYLKLYNAAQGSTTCGSGTPADRMMIPANASGTGFIWSQPNGVAYGTAITACVTTGFADNDTTAPAASAYLVSFYYK